MNEVNQILNPSKELFTDIVDFSLSQLVEFIPKHPEILENIPYLGTIFKIGNIANAVQNIFFIKKYACFIGEIKEDIFSNALNAKKIVEISRDEKTAEKIIQNTILSLDRQREEKLSRLLGVLFKKTFVEKLFTIEEYNTLLFDLENMHPYLGLKRLETFYDFDKKLKDSMGDEILQRGIMMRMASVDFSPLITTQLIIPPKGASTLGNLGGAKISELGRKFYENVVVNISER